MPAGYEMTWGGEFENQQRAMARLHAGDPARAAASRSSCCSRRSASLFDALVILLNVPFALVGGVVGLAVAGMPLSVSAAVGFIALLGQAVLNGVLVVAAIRARIDKGEELLEAAVGGARDRLRAVLMTALLASLGLLPAALSHAIGSETQRPIAVVVVGGTISAALLTLSSCRSRTTTPVWCDTASLRDVRLRCRGRVNFSSVRATQGPCRMRPWRVIVNAARRTA